ncbi:hypothetical protein L3X38_032163 [Prunus dulcis]|uniref:Uncharacterized protein n=1 Tax=Prunus dulcis TaxID=3755 RepID=A0AAD4YVN2_PRUDU|nr:hypothetical protein L3X38_032163 [Prunus dulcis]
MGPKRGGVCRGTKQSSRQKGHDSQLGQEEVPVPAPVPEPDVGIKQRGLGAIDFDGDGTPAVAEEWIERMEQIMEVMAVPQNSRVILATFFLIRNARHW